MPNPPKHTLTAPGHHYLSFPTLWRVGSTDPLLGCPHPHLGVFLRHVLLGELGKLHKLGDNLLDIIAVGAVDQGGSH